MRILAFLTLLLCVSGDINVVFSQVDVEYRKASAYLKSKGELYFCFDIREHYDITILTKIISIDNVRDSKVYAYANEKGLPKCI